MSPHLSRVPAPHAEDAALVALYHTGELQALNLLLERYRWFVRAKARSYFLVGGDFDDIEQEGMIGLYKAARDFRPERESSFRAFAELCITRQIISAIKAATRQKHQPLNQYVSLSGLPTSDDAGERALEELLDDHQAPDPADEVVLWEHVDEIRASMAKLLSTLEVEVLRLYVEGRSYHEISCLLGRHAKAVDNALQRIKRKLESQLDAGDAPQLAAAVA